MRRLFDEETTSKKRSRPTKSRNRRNQKIAKDQQLQKIVDNFRTHSKKIIFKKLNLYFKKIKQEYHEFELFKYMIVDKNILESYDNPWMLKEYFYDSREVIECLFLMGDLILLPSHKKSLQTFTAPFFKKSDKKIATLSHFLLPDTMVPSKFEEIILTFREEDSVDEENKISKFKHEIEVICRESITRESNIRKEREKLGINI